MNTEQFTPEPEKTWERKDYDLKKLEKLSWRERAEVETTRDLSKPIEQLVCDYHDIAEMVINPNAARGLDINWYLIQAEKRMVSLMGRVALEHERSSKWLVRLTTVLVVMTGVLIVMTGALIWLTVFLVQGGK